MKNILVPTDFSECSNVAARVAIKIANSFQAEVHFLHILLTPVDWVKLPIEKEKLYPEVVERITEARSNLDKLKSEATSAGLKVSSFIVFNSTSEEIESHVESHSHDFIVMGSQGKKNRMGFVGSNTKKIIRDSKVPVLIVGETHDELAFNKIVFASTFEKDTLPAYKTFLAFCKMFTVEVHLVYVNVPYNFHETGQVAPKIDVFLSELNPLEGKSAIVNATSEERGIQYYSNTINADMLCVAAHGKTGLMRLISPSVAESLVSNARLPVLYLNI